MTNKVAMIGLDACDVELVRQWSAEGKLPTFKKLIEQSKNVKISSSCEVLQGSIWPSFFTAKNPAEHGMYYMLQMANGTQNIKRVKASDLKCPSFWSALSSAKKCLIIDVPKLGLARSINTIQVVEWAAMDRYSSFSTYPTALANDIKKKFGYHLLSKDHAEPVSAQDFEQFVKTLIDDIHKKTLLNIELNKQHAPDFLLTVYGETHLAGHLLWRRNHLGESDDSSSALLSVYQAIDQSLAMFLDSLAKDCNVLVFSGHGMMEDNYPRQLMAPILSKMGLLTTAKTNNMGTANKMRSRLHSAFLWRAVKQWANQNILPNWIQQKLWIHNLQKNIDFENSKSWVLPTDLQGFIRINLIGREPQGNVSTAEYDVLLNDIKSCLLALKNADTGEAIVDKVFKVRQLYPQSPYTDLLPDLSVLWCNKSVERIDSPTLGEIQVPPLTIRRSGNHRPEGFCFVSGPNINPLDIPMAMDITDIGPWVMALLADNKSSASCNGK
jgi:predicted AlkP superfamily phosphohydrolase/phosphomutase